MRPNRARAALVISSAAESSVRSVWTVSRFSALPSHGCSRRRGLQRLTIAIDAGDPDTCCEQGPMQRTVQVYDVVDNGTRTTNRREISTRNRAAPMASASMSTAICGAGFQAARPRTGWPSSP